MKLSLLQKIVEFKIITQALALKQGALAVLSMPLAISVTNIVKVLMQDVKMYNVVLPLITISVGMVLYLIVWCFDFITGLVASGHETKRQKGWIESNKLYNSLIKLFIVYVIGFIFLAIALLLVVISYEKTSVYVVMLASMVNILALTYELHSINENIFRRTGKTVKLLSFFDRITTLIETKIIYKINQKFK